MSDSHSVPIQVNKAAAEVSLQIEKIYANKNFSKLVSGRNRLVCSLLSIIFIGYFGFLGVVCLMPGFAAKPFFAGSGLTVGIAAELALFLLFLIISTIYVSFANGKFDPMLRHLVEKAGDGRAQ
ncbi:DUF485 domain-containing protein [Achromobacter sp. 413638]|uniref:DUF485 domain-containing protein n=1 Tax=Achromobacter sp. 413638 TaxID=3342385 RepID=UPI0032496D38